MTNEPPNPADRPNRIPWPPILLAAVVIGAFALDAVMPVTWPGLNDGPARTIGACIGLAGLLLVAWAVSTLLAHDTTFMPDQPVTHLVTSGPYAWRRNPIYLGEILMLFGAAELTKNVWFIILAAAFAVLITVLQIVPEERHLEARFGNAWRDYAARTKRWI